MVNVLLLDHPLGSLDATPCTPLWIAFALSYQQCLSSQGVLQVKLCHYELETIEKCQTTDSDYDFELLIDIRKKPQC